MSQQTLQRWAPLSGVAFVVLMVTGFLVAGSSPSADDSDAKIARYLAKGSNQDKNIIAFFILLLAMLFLVWFFNTLRSWLTSAEGGNDRRGSLAFGAGIASVVFLVTAIMVFVSPLFTASDAGQVPARPGDLPGDAGSRLRDLGRLGRGGLAGGVGHGGGRVRDGRLPRWFAWFSVVVGVICLVAFLFIPIFVYWLWIVIASTLIYTRPGVEAARRP